MENLQKTEKRAVEEGVGNEILCAAGSALNAPMFSLRGKKWIYRGEGNANVVISLPQEQKVIRLRKKCKKSHGETATFSLEAKFCTKVMIPLLGSCYVKPPAIISIDRQEILELEDKLVHQRPVSRLHKGIQSVDAAVYMDYTLLPTHLRGDSSNPRISSTYCIEIKPKQGWVPKPDRLFHKCKFCLHQYLKVKTKKVDCHSQYCPLDLFSGNLWRMKKALSALLDNPQNNFKIFKDGALVYGQEVNGSALPTLKEWLGAPSGIHDHKKLLEKFHFILIEALTRDIIPSRKTHEKTNNKTISYFSKFTDKNSGENDLNGSVCLRYHECDIVRLKSDIEGQVTEQGGRIPIDLLKAAKAEALQALQAGKDFSCQWETHDQDKFPENCVLQRILHVQKLDTYGAEHVYREYHRERNLVGNLSDFSYIPSLMASDSVLSSIHRYLLATTAKDCSIMVTFQEDLGNRNISHHKQSTILCPDGQKFLFSIGIIDLEPKPISCIERHVARDCEVLKAYINQHVALQD